MSDVPPAPGPTGRLFFEKEKLEKADERRGKDRSVFILGRDYEAGLGAEMVDMPSGRPRKRILGKQVGSLVGGFEDLSREKERVKIALKAEREAERAKNEADEARRRKEQQEEKLEDLTEKKEKITAQEREEMMSSLADKKESLLEEAYEEAVKLAEMEAKLKRAEEQQKIEAARRKWYDPEVRVPADMIYTHKNVREKQEDMDSLVKEIALDAARARRRRRGD